MKKVKNCLQNEFVLQHLAFDHITRNEVIERNIMIPKRLFGNVENTKAQTLVAPLMPQLGSNTQTLLESLSPKSYLSYSDYQLSIINQCKQFNLRVLIKYT